MDIAQAVPRSRNSDRVAFSASLLIAAAIAWFLAIRWPMDMATMSVLPREMSMSMTAGMSLGTFMAGWVPMMAAMMLPSVAPVAVLWTKSRRSTAGSLVAGNLRTLQFAAGYLVVWAASGMPAYYLARLIAGSAGSGTRHDFVLAGIVAVVAIYQLSPLKHVCLGHCRSPVSSLLHYSSFRGPAVDVRVGFFHGVYCFGCCIALMVLFVAATAMGLAAVIAFAAVIFIEKVWRHGDVFARAAGWLMLAGAPLIALYR